MLQSYTRSGFWVSLLGDSSRLSFQTFQSLKNSQPGYGTLQMLKPEKRQASPYRAISAFSEDEALQKQEATTHWRWNEISKVKNPYRVTPGHRVDFNSTENCRCSMGVKGLLWCRYESPWVSKLRKSVNLLLPISKNSVALCLIYVGA